MGQDSSAPPPEVTITLLRSDNSIKNHFYSTLRKAFRSINRYITTHKRRTEQRPFKKNILSKIILLAEESFRQTLQVDREEI